MNRWIVAAKRQETRNRRPKEAIARLEQNHKLGLKGERKAAELAGCSGLAKSGQPLNPELGCARKAPQADHHGTMSLRGKKWRSFRSETHLRKALK
jgi:hypothetical protein